MNSVVVQELEQNREHHLELTLMAGRKGLKKTITHSQVQRNAGAVRESRAARPRGPLAFRRFRSAGR